MGSLTVPLSCPCPSDLRGRHQGSLSRPPDPRPRTSALLFPPQVSQRGPTAGRATPRAGWQGRLRHGLPRRVTHSHTRAATSDRPASQLWCSSQTHVRPDRNEVSSEAMGKQTGTETQRSRAWLFRSRQTVLVCGSRDTAWSSAKWLRLSSASPSCPVPTHRHTPGGPRAAPQTHTPLPGRPPPTQALCPRFPKPLPMAPK